MQLSVLSGGWRKTFKCRRTVGFFVSLYRFEGFFPRSLLLFAIHKEKCYTCPSTLYMRYCEHEFHWFTPIRAEMYLKYLKFSRKDVSIVTKRILAVESKHKGKQDSKLNNQISILCNCQKISILLKMKVRLLLCHHLQLASGVCLLKLLLTLHKYYKFSYNNFNFLLRNFINSIDVCYQLVCYCTLG